MNISNLLGLIAALKVGDSYKAADYLNRMGPVDAFYYLPSDEVFDILDAFGLKESVIWDSEAKFFKVAVPEVSDNDRL